MIGLLFRVFNFLLCGSFLCASSAFACSTFMLSRDDCLIIGHNLDQDFYTPGMIHINRRSEKKRSVSTFDLKMADIETPILEWKTKYGSVTFSNLGRNLPDGGMNEAGLTVSEMGLDLFVAFSPEADHSVIDRFLRSLLRFVAKTDEPEKMDRYMLNNYGMDVNSYVTRAYEVTELIRSNKDR